MYIPSPILVIQLNINQEILSNQSNLLDPGRSLPSLSESENTLIVWLRSRISNLVSMLG